MFFVKGVEISFENVGSLKKEKEIKLGERQKNF